jgi:hypothetical protein
MSRLLMFVDNQSAPSLRPNASSIRQENAAI